MVQHFMGAVNSQHFFARFLSENKCLENDFLQWFSKHYTSACKHMKRFMYYWQVTWPVFSCQVTCDDPKYGRGSWESYYRGRRKKYGFISQLSVTRGFFVVLCCCKCCCCQVWIVLPFHRLEMERCYDIKEWWSSAWFLLIDNVIFPCLFFFACGLQHYLHTLVHQLHLNFVSTPVWHIGKWLYLHMFSNKMMKLFQAFYRG